MSEAAKPSPRRLIPFAIGAIVLLAALAWLADYLLVGQYIISTDDAYITADSAMIAPKITGYVTSVNVTDNQFVHQGDLLATIDLSDYQTALTTAAADTQAAQATILTTQAQLPLQQAKIAAAQATIQGDEARLAFATQNQTRYARLSASGASPIQTADQATTDTATARAQLAQDQATLLATTRETDVLNATLAQAEASLAQAQSHEAQARLDLSHTKITAPFDGTVGAKSVAPGDYLTPGTQIMAIVPLNHVYILANYKESQLTRIAPGQPVNITVDAYPNLHVTGTVNSIAPASGQQFALLPPDNATGNFTKIVQRIPVKITINLTPTLTGKLLPGMSVEPAIRTDQ